MQYVSTRGGSPALMSAEAIKMGLAPDGGLFVPVEAVRVSPDELASFPTLSYQELAVRILSRFLTDYGEAELQACVAAAYGPDRFENGDVAPLVKLSNGLHVMELWHGPTCAFKDVALQILPQFMTRAMRMTGEDRDIVILVATSGDTGKAALEGFADVEGTRMAVFFPSEGVSEVQKRQMLTQTGGNVHVVAVEGNFDDTQTGVKHIFSDAALAEQMTRKGLAFSSANSINWGRLVPQIVYYFSAYASLCKTGDIRCGDPVNFAVPTGNFGNILAAWYARAMGLPVGKLICASNDNNVLSDFLNTGIYDRNRPFHKTASPSMDILISSNLERLLFELSGRDAAQVTAWMASLGQTGRYDVGESMKSEIGNLFHGDWADGQATRQAIVDAWQSWGYVPDTHTAVALDVWKRYAQSTGDTTPTVIASTASPFKFSDHVVSALFGPEALKGKDEFALLELLAEKTGWPVPKGLQSLKTRPVLHNLHCEADRMRQTVMDLLALNEEGGAHA
jgi:threonine synthase